MYVNPKKNPRPRNITAPPECSKASMGPFIYHLDQIYSKMDETYCGGMNWT